MNDQTPFIGRSMTRREDRRLLTGRGQYIADLDLPHMLHAVFVRSPQAHARIKAIDMSRAAAAPGVAFVLTGPELARVLPPVSDTQVVLPSKWTALVQHKFINPQQPLLAHDKVRHVGEAVAVIVADNRYAAEDAAQLVELDLEPLPPVLDPEAALRDGATIVHDKFSTNLLGAFTIGKGDADAVLKRAPRRLQRRFYHHRYVALPMECRGVVGLHDARTDTVTIWSATQVVHWLKREASGVLQLPEAKIRCVALDVGGGFGVKGHVYPEDLLIPYLARRLGRPVKWIEDRYEHMLCSCHSRDQIHDVEIGFDDDGRILALRDHFLVDCGAWNPIGAGIAYNTAVHVPGPYKIGAIAISSPHRRNQQSGERAVSRRRPPRSRLRHGAQHRPRRHGAWPRARRGAAAQHDPRRRNALRGRHALSRRPAHRARRRRLSGRAAKSAGRARRRRGVSRPPARCAAGGALSRSRHRLLRRRHRCRPVRERAPSHRSVRQDFRYLGRLSARPGHGDHFLADRGRCLAGHARRRRDLARRYGGDRRRLRHHCQPQHGDAVGGDPWRHGKTTRKMFSIAANMLECSATDLELRRGHVGIVGVPGAEVSLAKVALAARPGWDNGRPTGVDAGLEETYYFEPPTVTWSYAAHAAVVEVDIELGRVKIENYAIAHDCGVVVNPMLVEGQIVGGAVQGLGGALLEEIKYDAEGQPLTTTLADYMLPTACDLPPITIIHQHSPSPLNPFGVKGVGEGGPIAPPVVIANAVSDALRPFKAEFNRTPVTPQQIDAAVRDRLR